MENTSGNRPGFPRTMFLIALLITLGAALAVLQTSQPVREAFGLEPIIEGLPARTLWTNHLPTGPFDGPVALLPSSATNVRHELTTVRRLGNGTRRARLLTQGPVLSVPATTQPVVSVDPSVAVTDIVDSSAWFSE